MARLRSWTSLRFRQTHIVPIDGKNSEICIGEKRKPVCQFFPFSFLKSLEFNKNTISFPKNLHFFIHKFFAYCGVSDSNQGIRFFAQGGIHCFKEFFAQRPFTILKEWWVGSDHVLQFWEKIRALALNKNVFQDWAFGFYSNHF